MVEMCDDCEWHQFPSGHLCPIEQVQPGNFTLHPSLNIPVRVLEVVSQPTGGMWPLAQYMGLTCDCAQMVCVGRTWMNVVDAAFGTTCVSKCSELFAVVLENCDIVRVDGVVCQSHWREVDSVTEDISTQENPRCDP